MRERNHPEVEQEDTADAKRDERHWAEQAEQRAVGLLAMEVLPLLRKHAGSLRWNAMFNQWCCYLSDTEAVAFGPTQDASPQAALATVLEADAQRKVTFSEIVNEVLASRKAS